jgi:hypothetical protein
VPYSSAARDASTGRRQDRPVREVSTPSAAPARVSYATACLDLINYVHAGADLLREFINDPQRLADGAAATTARFDTMIGQFEYYSSVAPTTIGSLYR